jgi:acyl carrier protein
MRDADRLAHAWQLASGAAVARGCVLNHHGQVCPAWVRGELYLYQSAPSAETVPHPESGEPLIRTGLAARRIPGGGPDGEITGEIDSEITGGITGEIEGTIEGRIELTIGGRIEQLSHPGGRAQVRGLDVELGLVEHLIARHPDVGECAVQLDEAGGVPTLRAYVAPTAVTPRALGDALASVLPEFLLPARIIALPALPRRPDGTIDRAALGAAEPVVTAAPASELEAIVRRIWAEVLGLPEDAVPLDRGFFDLGANSLLLVRVADRVHAETGRRLEIADYFRYLTIAALARALAPDHPHGDDLVVARSRSRAAARRNWLSARTAPDAGAREPVSVELEHRAALQAARGAAGGNR